MSISPPRAPPLAWGVEASGCVVLAVVWILFLLTDYCSRWQLGGVGGKTWLFLNGCAGVQT